MRAVNLIPSEQRPGAGGTYGRSGGVAYAIVGLACGLVAMTVLWLMAHRDVTTRGAQVAQLGTEATQAQNEASSLAAYSSFVSTSDSRVASVEQLAQDRFDWAHAFHELGRVLPFDVSLTSVDGTIATGSTSSSSSSSTSSSGSSASAAPASTSATPAGSVPTLAIAGCTTSQSEVAYTMQRLALMDGVTNVTLQSSTGGSSTTGSATASSSGSGACPFTFTVSVTFTALPTVSPTAATGAAPTPTAGTPASAGAGTSAATASSGAAPSVSTASAATPGSASSAPATTGGQ